MPKLHCIVVTSVWCALLFVGVPAASANPTANRVVLLLEGNTLPADVGPAVVSSLAARGLNAMHDSGLKAALSFGNYKQTTPRPDEELRLLLRETNAAYLFEIQGKAGAGPDEIAVRVVAWNATEKQTAIGMVARGTTQTQVAQLVLQALDRFPRTQAAAPATAAVGPAATPAPRGGGAAADAVHVAPPASAGSPAPAPKAKAKAKSLTPTGFYYRGGLGFGSSSMNNQDVDASISGTGPAFSHHFGLMLGDVGVGLTTGVRGMLSPSFTSNGMSSSPDDSDLLLALVGGFVEYYPRALSNWHFTGSFALLLSTLTVAEESEESSGTAITLGAGREWKLSKRWSWGVTGAITFGSTSRTDPDVEFSVSSLAIMGTIRVD